MSYTPEKLTQEEIFNNTLWCEGELYLMDENHSGTLYLTDECVDKYNLIRELDVDLIDWDDILGDYENDPFNHYKQLKDKGFKWEYYVCQFTEVYDVNGNYLRKCVYENWEVCKVNGFQEEMLEDEGCEIIGWCDG